MSKVYNAFLAGFIKAAVVGSISTGVDVQQAPKVDLQPSRLSSDVSKSIQNPVSRDSSGVTTPIHPPSATPATSTAPVVGLAKPDIYAKLKQQEGFRSNTYNDTLGHKTIGYGSTDPNLLRLGHVTEPMAASALTNKVHSVDAEVAKLVGDRWGTTPQPIKDSVDNLGYQTGSLTKWPNLLQSLRSGDYATTAKEMQNSLVNKQTPGRNAGRIQEIQDFLTSQSNVAKL